MCEKDSFNFELKDNSKGRGIRLINGDSVLSCDNEGFGREGDVGEIVVGIGGCVIVRSESHCEVSMDKEGQDIGGGMSWMGLYGIYVFERGGDGDVEEL